MILQSLLKQSLLLAQQKRSIKRVTNSSMWECRENDTFNSYNWQFLLQNKHNRTNTCRCQRYVVPLRRILNQHLKTIESERIVPVRFKIDGI